MIPVEIIYNDGFNIQRYQAEFSAVPRIGETVRSKHGYRRVQDVIYFDKKPVRVELGPKLIARQA